MAIHICKNIRHQTKAEKPKKTLNNNSNKERQTGLPDNCARQEEIFPSHLLLGLLSPGPGSQVGPQVSSPPQFSQLSPLSLSLYFSFIIQGSAADLAKTALLMAEEKLAQNGVESVLVMMIHDEMVWEVKEADISTAAAVVKQSLETCGAALGLELETRVKITVCKTWGDLSELADCI